MKYEQLSNGSNYPYPDNNINPKLKDDAWCMKYAKAAYFDWNFLYSKGIFANNNGDYEKYRMYGLGKQPIRPYQKLLGVEEGTNNTWLSIDWSVRPIVSLYRDMAISRLMKQDFSIVATPIDMTAKAELDQYYADMKAKFAVRQLMQGQDQELAAHPLISTQSGEPMDMEELEMRMELGEQFNRSKDAELAVELGFYENNYKHVRKTFYEDLFDFGVAGYKEWLGDDNKAKFRRVNPECVVTNFCRQGDFSDLIHAGEVIDVSLIDLALVKDEFGNKKFTDEQLSEFAGTIAGKWGNPNMIGKGTGWYKPYDKFKCKVLDLEFYSYDEYVHSTTVDESGNIDYRGANYNRGKQSEKYDRKCFQMIYKVKWIIGTDYCYDAGLLNNMKRSVNPKTKSQTRLSYQFYAYNFYEMKAQSYMERLIPYLDDYQLTIYKIQNFKNRSVPSGWWIDLEALENVALSKGGAVMQPKELLQMFFETGVLVGRSKDLAGEPMGVNWKPVIPIENTAASELAMFYQDLLQTLSAIERITGYNQITAGNPNPKTLVPGYETAENSTEDALYPMKFAEQYLSERLAEDVLLRMQQGVRKGSVEGYAPYANALNPNILSFIKVSEEISARDYGVMLQEKTTEQQKIWIMQQVQQDIANGSLDTSDAVLIINTHNVKQAMVILSYKVKKNKELAHQRQMQLVQEQGNQNQQVAAMTAQAAQQEKAMEYQFKLMEKEMEIKGELAKEKMRLESEERIASQTNFTKLQVGEMAAESRQGAAETQATAKVVSQHLDNLSEQERQKLANSAPPATTKK